MNFRAEAKQFLRDTLLWVGLDRAALLQSVSWIGESFAGATSFRPRTEPSLLDVSSFELAIDGLNLLPMAHASSFSAGLAWVSDDNNPEPLRLKEGTSDSEARGGRPERQSFVSSATLLGWRSPAGISWRRREESRGGRGPSRLQGLSNLEWSSDGPLKPLLSFAIQLLAMIRTYRRCTHEVQQRWPGSLVRRRSSIFNIKIGIQKNALRLLQNPFSSSHALNLQGRRIRHNRTLSVCLLYPWWF